MTHKERLRLKREQDRRSEGARRSIRTRTRAYNRIFYSGGRLTYGWADDPVPEFVSVSVQVGVGIDIYQRKQRWSNAEFAERAQVPEVVITNLEGLDCHYIYRMPIDGPAMMKILKVVGDDGLSLSDHLAAFGDLCPDHVGDLRPV